MTPNTGGKNTKPENGRRRGEASITTKAMIARRNTQKTSPTKMGNIVIQEPLAKFLQL